MNELESDLVCIIIPDCYVSIFFHGKLNGNRDI